MHSLPFDIELRRAQLLTRRSLLGSSTVSLGAFALGNLLKREKAAAAVEETKSEGLPELPHFAPKAKRVIYLFQSGGPSHVDLAVGHRGPGRATNPSVLQRAGVAHAGISAPGAEAKAALDGGRALVAAAAPAAISQSRA